MTTAVNTENEPIIVLDIDETLIASRDKNEKEIYRQCLNDSVMEYAKKLGTQYQEMNINDDIIGM